MRIYFVGAHSTGKTTLARYVAKKYRLPLITEVARTVLAEMELSLESLRTDVDLVGSYQTSVFERQIRTEQETGEKSGFVSDRAFDNIAYAIEHSHVAAELVSHTRFTEYLSWVSKGAVFFVRPHRALLREDGVREKPEWDSVLRIDGMIKALLEINCIPYLPIETGSMQERCRIVDFVVEREFRLGLKGGHRAEEQEAVRG